MEKTLHKQAIGICAKKEPARDLRAGSRNPNVHKRGPLLFILLDLFEVGVHHVIIGTGAALLGSARLGIGAGLL
jgi:hypothetical protein